MCSLDGPREFSAICSLIAMYVNDFRNNETVIVTSEKVGTGYTYFQRFFFLRAADGNTSAGLKTMVYSCEKSFLIRSLHFFVFKTLFQLVWYPGIGIRESC